MNVKVKKDPTVRLLQSPIPPSGFSSAHYLWASSCPKPQPFSVDSSHLQRISAGICTGILVLCLIKEPERWRCITTAVWPSTQPPHTFSKYVHKCTGERQWAQRRLCWCSVLHPRVINPTSDRQASRAGTFRHRGSGDLWIDVTSGV